MIMIIMANTQVFDLSFDVYVLTVTDSAECDEDITHSFSVVHYKCLTNVTSKIIVLII